MKKVIWLSIMTALLLSTVTGCKGNDETSSTPDTTSSVSTTTSVVEDNTVNVEDEELVAEANLESGLIGKTADTVGLDKGLVIGTSEQGATQVTGVSFYGVKGTSEYTINDEGNIESYTLYTLDIAENFEYNVNNAVKGLETEIGETLVYTETEMNEGKNGATTVEALKKGNLFCNYASSKEGSCIQIWGNGDGTISMLVQLNVIVQETEMVEEDTSDGVIENNEPVVAETSTITEENDEEVIERES